MRARLTHWIAPNKRLALLPILCCVVVVQGCGYGTAVDEARSRQLANPETRDQPIADYAAEYYPPEAQDLFHAMDGKADHGTYQELKLTPQDVVGRNAWLLWTGNNEAFWDWLSRNGYGTIDLLKAIDPKNRGTQWTEGGLVTEPGMRPPTDEETKAAFGIRFARPIKADYSMYNLKQRNGDSHRSSEMYYRVMAPYGATYDSPDNYQMPSYIMPTTNEVGETEGPYGDYQPPDPYVYGFSSGIVGLRLFPNPEFNPSKGFDYQRYYDPEDSYSRNPDTIRPFRVGMSCAFCHVGPHPLNPPANEVKGVRTDKKRFAVLGSPEFPKWENLSSTIGAQYLRVRVALGGNLPKDNYFYHVLDSQLPGTIDTSLIASDGINNANTMNAIFGLGSRVDRARFNQIEQLDKSPAEFPGLWAGDNEEEIRKIFGDLADDRGQIGKPGGFEGNPRLVPRILVDGSDSDGSWIALARVYLNIGLYHQRWIQVQNTILGFREQQPFTLADCEANSVYWHATKIRVDPMTAFFLKSSNPMKLRDAPDGLGVGWDGKWLKEAAERYAEKEKKPGDNSDSENESTEKTEIPPFDGDPMDVRFTLGRQVFARSCIACHSSVQPGTNDTLESQIAFNEICKVEERDSLDLSMDDLQELTRGSGHLPRLYQRWAEKVVEKPLFWKNNFLSTDRRIPVSLVQTNAGRASATNAKSGHIWQDFASATYKDLPSVGDVPYFDPFSKSTKSFQPESGGPGYYRVPTLISAWATAPFLHNNALGKFNNDPSVKGRLNCFEDAIGKLLNPETRAALGHDRGKAKDAERVSEEVTKFDRGLVWRTNAESHFIIPGSNVPSLVAGEFGISFPVAKYIIPWILSILFVALMLIFLFSGPISRFLLKFRRFIPFPEVVIPLKILVGVAFLVLAVLLFYLAFRYRGYFQLLDANWSFPFAQVQSYIPAIALLAISALVLLTYLSGSVIGRVFLKFVAFVCFVFAVVTSVLTGPTLAGRGGDIKLGPFPKGMPVNLISNFDSQSNRRDQLTALHAAATYLSNAPYGEKEALAVFERDVAPALLKVSKCPDIVLDHGHDYQFIHNMTDQEKHELTQLIKSF